ncbi:MAG: hypothetical protein AB8B86_12455 [Pseudomonadales bacterium]
MSQLQVPNFGELLAPFISSVPAQAMPNFLALLERGAAQRYRHWAEKLPEFREGLTACADSEDEIANIVERVFPIDPALTDELQAPLPAARETYYEAFAGLSLADQLGIQADAELQGAEAWRAMLSDDNSEELQAGLMKCITLEQESSAYLYSIIDAVKAAEQA